MKHAMQAQRRSRDIALMFFNLGARMEWVVMTKTGLLYPWKVYHVLG